MELTFFSSSFCDPCTQTRAVLSEVRRLVPQAKIRELDVAQFNDEAAAAGIRSTPTVVISDATGAEVFRAAGVPTIDQVLVAVSKAL